MTRTALLDREAVGATPNPLGLAGIEFIEYATDRPQAFGQTLERMGFRPVARHRSREVTLYRQGELNLVVNAHANTDGDALNGITTLSDGARISAVGLRVRDAASAWRRTLDLGAWSAASRVGAMELNIPAIHGPGGTRLYFVDRWKTYSIFDVDFVPIPTVDLHPPAIADLRFFGLVQYIGLDRMSDWTTFYEELFGFVALDPQRRFGVLPQGRILASPCGTFWWQLIEPAPDAAEIDGEELLQRAAFGAADVLSAVTALRQRGVEFVEASEGVHTSEAGALTQPDELGVAFELVRRPTA